MISQTGNRITERVSIKWNRYKFLRFINNYLQLTLTYSVNKSLVYPTPKTTEYPSFDIWILHESFRVKYITKVNPSPGSRPTDRCVELRLIRSHRNTRLGETAARLTGVGTRCYDVFPILERPLIKWPPTPCNILIPTANFYEPRGVLYTLSAFISAARKLQQW